MTYGNQPYDRTKNSSMEEHILKDPFLYQQTQHN
jgi:hypothetical protein